MSREAPRELSIAIVGMACRFPGAATPDEFWTNLRDGIESITIVQAPPAHSPHVMAAGLLEDVDRFDAEFFGMSPREAELTDPQHRLFLEIAWEALERAGYDPRQYEGEIGIFAGTGASSYLVERILPHRSRIRLGAEAYQVIIGNNKDHLTTRAAFKLGLTGPAVTVQSACSTSLVAVHLASRSLLAGDCDMALAGGVSLLLPEHAGRGYEPGGIVSPDGHCRAFDADANGTVFGSGAGIVVLKRYADALRDGDEIHAVVRGSAINNDGSAKPGYTAPSVDAQARVVRLAHLVSDVPPDSIAYVEGHGTGTPLGDPIEMAALAQAFRAATRTDRFCGIGSVKSNIGHLDAAAGVAGLIKVALCLEHEAIPPTLHFRAPNPRLRLEATPFYVTDHLVGWPAAEAPRRAGVSAFGVGGTNAHVVVEEAPPAEPVAPARSSHLLSVSARSATALDEATRNLAAHLRSRADADLADVAFTLHVGRASFPCRRSFVCRDLTSAIAKLQSAIEPGRAAGPIDRADRPVVFLFPGQGSDYRGMATGLYRSEAVFRRAFDEASGSRADEVLRALEGPALSTGQAQPALFAVEYALGRLWLEWGVTPRALVGHSLGEYVAACLAGVWSVDDAARLVRERARLMEALPAGAMTSVALGERDVWRWLDDDVSLAACNGESLSVVSGPVESITRVERRLAEAGHRTRRLSVSRAFHSAMMEPIVRELEAVLRTVTCRPPRIPVLSNVTGDWMSPDAAVEPAYWLRQLRQPVQFARCVTRLVEREPDAVLLETGPGDTLIRLAGLQPPAASLDRFASLPAPPREASDVECLLETLGRLWSRGVAVSWPGLYAGQRRRRVGLPTYPFQRERYSFEAGRSVPPALDQAADGRDPADGGVRFYVPAWREDVLAPPRRSGGEPDRRTAPATPDRHRRWIVLGDGDVARAFASALADGDEVVLVRAGREFRAVDGSHYEIDPSDGSHYEQLFDLALLPGSPHRIVDLRPARADGGREPPVAGFQAVTAVARALGSRPAIDARLVVVTTNGQPVIGDEPLQPERSMLVGAVLAVPQEYPHLSCRAVDLSASTTLPLAVAALVDEVRREDGAPVVALRGTRRWVRRFESIDIPATRPPRGLRARGVYVLLGGTGQVGLQIAQYLARATRARLALVSRAGSPTDRRAVDVLASIQASGGEVLVLRADIADQAQLRRALDATRARYGAIDGVFHAAGTKTRRLVDRLDRAACDDVFRARVSGLPALEEALAGTALDFCFVISSLATVVAGPGLAAYAASHLFAEAFVADHNRRHSTAWTAVAWDNWLSAEQSALAASAGREEPFLTATQGIEALERLLSTSVPTGTVVCSGDLDRRVDRARQPRLPGPGAPVALHRRPDLRTPFVAPRAELEERIAAIWRAALGIEDVGVDDNFFELGGDSVVAVQILSRLSEIGIQLSPKQVFESQTIASLAAAASHAVPIAAEQGPVSGPVCLTPVQRRFLARALGTPGRFTLAVLLDSSERLAPALVEACLDALLAHHDMLRALFRPSAGAWEQAVAGVVPPRVLAMHDLSDLPADEQPPAVDRETERLRDQVDLHGGRVFGAALFDLGGGRSQLVFVVHHLVADAYSCLLLVHDFELAYEQLSLGADIRLPRKTTSYQQWARRLQDWAASSPLQGELGHWLAAADGEPLLLPAPQAGSGPCSRASFQCTPELTARLLRARPTGTVAVDAVLLTAIAHACRAATGQRSLVVEVDGHGRDPVFPEIDVTRTVGWFTAPFPVTIRMADGDHTSASVAAVTRAVRDAPSGGIGYGLLRYVSTDGDAARRLSALPPANVGFVYLGAIEGAQRGSRRLRLATERMLEARLDAEDLGHAVEIVAFIGDARLTVSWSYDPSRIPPAMLGRIVAGTERALESIADRLEEAPVGPAAPPLPGISSSSPPLVLLGPRTAAASFFCVHPAGGTVLPYVDVARRISHVQPLAALQCRGLAEASPAFRSIEAMASDYVDAVLSVQPEGPYWLGGWSMGGTIAFEMARQLEARGKDVARVVMFDTRPPGSFPGLPEEGESRLVVGFALATLFYAGRRPALPLDDLARRPAQECWPAVVEALRGPGVLPPGIPEEELRRLYRVWTNNLRAVQRYEPTSTVRAPLTVMRAQDPPPPELAAWLSEGVADRGALDGWSLRSLAGVEWVDVPGSHYTMFNEPHGAVLADALAACLARARARVSGLA